MKSGQIIINGIDDRDLIKILEIKEKHEGELIFQPNVLQMLPLQPPQPTRPNVPHQPPQQPQQRKPQVYNNAIISFNSEKGLHAVLEILKHLSEERA